MDEHRQAPRSRSSSISGCTDRVVRVVTVDQRVKLHPQELRVLEELARLVGAPRDARIRPDEP